jgi:hypothetical protein
MVSFLVSVRRPPPLSPQPCRVPDEPNGSTAPPSGRRRRSRRPRAATTVTAGTRRRNASFARISRYSLVARWPCLATLWVDSSGVGPATKTVHALLERHTEKNCHNYSKSRHDASAASNAQDPPELISIDPQRHSHGIPENEAPERLAALAGRGHGSTYSAKGGNATKSYEEPDGSIPDVFHELPSALRSFRVSTWTPRAIRQCSGVGESPRLPVGPRSVAARHLGQPSSCCHGLSNSPPMLSTATGP